MTQSQRNTDRLGQAINSACEAELVVHPNRWELDERGAPAWLAALVPSGGHGWYRVDAELSALGPHPPDEATPRRFAMPQLAESLSNRLRPLPAPPRRGRHGLKEEQPQACCWKAWLADVEAMPLPQIASEDYVPSPARQASTDLRNLERRAQRRVVAGQELMNGKGVLPWMLWSSGDVPGGWWRRRKFRVVLEVWVRYHSALASIQEEINRRIEDEASQLIEWAEAELARTPRRSA